MKFKFRLAVFILAVLVVFAGVHLFFYTQNIGIKYRATDAKIKLQDLKSNNRALESQLAAQENLWSIEKTAKEKLKMFYPEQINYILPSEQGSKEATTSTTEANP